MTPTQINITIAEILGVQTDYFRFWGPSHGGPKWWDKYESEDIAIKTWNIFGFKDQPVESYKYYRRLSNYCNDLNACAEFERSLDLEGQDIYLEKLYRIVQDPHICQLTHAFAHVTATAPQRCEAYLRTIGMWVEPSTGDQP